MLNKHARWHLDPGKALEYRPVQANTAVPTVKRIAAVVGRKEY